jgi:hypothetical protein
LVSSLATRTASGGTPRVASEVTDADTDPPPHVARTPC